MVKKINIEKIHIVKTLRRFSTDSTKIPVRYKLMARHWTMTKVDARSKHIKSAFLKSANVRSFSFYCSF